MILVDSSVWIDYFRGTVTPQSDRLDTLLSSELLFMGDLILAEVLQGFTSERDFNQAKILLTAEETLGRKISPTLYGTAEFERKGRDDNHFVTRVLAQPKIFLKGTEDDLPAGQPA